MQQLVSIIIPVYNVEPYLKQCIDSVLKQTYKTIEIIIVDDGSNDACPQICDEYAKMDRRVQVIHKPNGGLSDARNVGVEHAKGAYICFVDSDDMVAEHYVEKLLKICEDFACDISICSFQSFFKVPLVAEVEDEGLSFYKKPCILENLYHADYLKTVVSCSKMYKSEIVKKYQYPKGLFHEDEATTAKYLYEAEKVGVTSKALYFYRTRPGSITQSALSEKRMDDKIKAIKERLFFYQKNHLERYVSLDQLRLLKTISKNSYLAYKEKKKSYCSKMKEEYQSLYRKSDSSAWNLKNKILMGITFLWTPFNGWICQIKRRNNHLW